MKLTLIKVNFIENNIGQEKMQTTDTMDAMLTVSEVAQLLHIHPNTLRRWSNEGRLNAFRITPRGDRRFKKQEVDRFLSQLSYGFQIESGLGK